MRRSILFPLSLLASALLLSACGDDSAVPAGPVTPPATTTSAAVTPSLGRIYNAAVEARCAATGGALGSGTTGSSGLVTLTLSGSCASPVIVELLASAGSTYFDEKLDSNVSLPAGTVLRAMVPTFTAGVPLAVAVTPVTELATRQALAAAGNVESALTAAQADAANTAVLAQLFGAGAPALDILTPPTVLDADSATGSLGTTDADRYAYYLATLAAMGGGATPALAVLDALAGDLVDGDLDGASGVDFSYDSGTFATQRDAALATMAGYASAELKTALGIDEDTGGGGGTGGGGDTGGGDAGAFPDETIVLSAVTRPTPGTPSDIAASEISSMVGTYTGVAAWVKRPEGTTTVSSCTVQVSSNGTYSVSADGLTITQSIVGTTSSNIVPSATYTGGWNVNVVPNPGNNVHGMNVYVRRNKLTYAQAHIVADTSAVPTIFTHEIRCWMAENRVPGTAGGSFSSASAANAGDFAASVVGSYTGTLYSNGGVAAPVGATCQLTVHTDGMLDFATTGTANPVSFSAQIAGDENDRVVGSGSSWTLLQARDYTDRPGNVFKAVQLQNVSGTLIAVGTLAGAGYGCTALAPVVAP